MEISEAFSKIIQKNCNYISIMNEMHLGTSSNGTSELLDEVEHSSKRCKISSSVDEYTSKLSSPITDLAEEELLTSIKNEAKLCNLDESCVAPTFLYAHLKQLVDLKNTKTNKAKELQNFLILAKIFKNNKLVIGNTVADKILSVREFFNLPLADIHAIVSTGVIRHDQIIARLHIQEHYMEFLKNIISAIINDNGSDHNRVILQNLLSTVIRLSYSLQEHQHDPVMKIASTLLQDITSRIINYVINEKHKLEDSNSKFINIYELLIDDPIPRIDKDILESYFCNELNKLLTHSSNIKLNEVLANHKNWRSTVSNKLLYVLILKLVCGVGWRKALSILNDVVTRQEVYWESVMILLTVILNVHMEAPAAVKALVDSYIKQACQEFDNEILILGFLFARQSSEEGQHIFPSYSHWISSTFGSEQSTPASTRQIFVFLMNFLSKLVPYDDEKTLRCHLNASYFCPRGCQEILQDYKHLIKARLRELRPQTEEQTSMLPVDPKIVSEVESAISFFTKCGKISNYVNEISVFRIPYFLGKFIPFLLTPRILPSEPDETMKFIAKLYEASKIPKTEYNAYLEKCKAARTAEISDVTKMQAPENKKVREIKSIFDTLLEYSKSQTSEDSSHNIVSTLSRLSYKIEDFMKSRDVKINADSNSLIIGRHLHNPIDEALPIIKHFLIILSGLCSEDNTRLSWLSQYILVLTSSVSIQAVLFNFILHVLTDVNDAVDTDQLKSIGILLAEISIVEGTFNLVSNDTRIKKQDSLSFISYFTQNASLSSNDQMTALCFLLSHYLEWCFKYHLNQELKISEDILNLYWCLAPRVVINELLTYNVSNVSSFPKCSCLFYQCAGNFKVPSFETWLKFELFAYWGKVSTNERQNYLLSRLFKYYASSEDDNSSYILFKKLFWFIVIEGYNKDNTSSLILLLQTLSFYCESNDISLLYEYEHFQSDDVNLKHKLVKESLLLSFMTVCHCLSPTLFLKSSKLTKPVNSFQQIIDLLKKFTNNICLSSVDVVYLTSALFMSSRHSSVVEACFRHIKIDIIYNWHGVKWLFTQHLQKMKSWPAIEQFYVEMNNNSQSIRFSPAENGMKKLSFILNSNTEMKLNRIEEEIMFLKFALRYIGCLIFNGLDIKFDSNETTDSSVDNAFSCLKVACEKGLKNLIEIKQMYSFKYLLNEDAETYKNVNLYYRSLLVSLSFITLSLLKSNKFDSDIKKLSVLLILIRCHFYLNLSYEKQSTVTSVFLKKNVRYATVSSDDSTIGMNNDIPSKIGGIIKCIINTMPLHCLTNIPSEILSLCDADVKSAIEKKCQNN